MPELKLADKAKTGHCKMLTFYFMDPITRIPSTEIVPPQQQDWYFEVILEFEPFCRLPLLILDGIMAEVDFPILLKAAKKLPPQVHLDKKGEDISLDFFFEPNIYFS
ncbi:hypothetical protein GGI03_001045, partial [Coemansia sp. RSA 2337]